MKVTAGLVVTATISLYAFDRHLEKRFMKELTPLYTMRQEACVLKEIAPDKKILTLSAFEHSEKEIFNLVVLEIDRIIDERKKFLNSDIPMFRSLIPPTKLQTSMDRALTKIGFDEEGFIHENFHKFYRSRKVFY